MSNLLDKASIILTPTAYNNGEALCVKPSDGSGDFDFSRNSAATRVNAQGLVENVQILSSNLVQNGDFSEEGVQEVSNGSFSQEGAQLVTNGDFSNGLNNWSVVGGSYASVNNGILNSNNTVNGSWFGQYIAQDVSFVNGKTYKITFKAKNISGNLNLRLTQGANVIVNYNLTSEFVSYTYYYTSNADNGSLRMFCNDAVGQFEIDNVSVREVGQDWVLTSGASIGENKLDINANAYDYFARQLDVSTIGKTYKVSVDAEIQSGRMILYLADTNAFEVIDTSGSYTFYIVADGTQIRFRAFDTALVGSITNISVKEVGQNWTFDANWSIGNNKAISTGAGRMFQSIPFLETNIGTKVKVSFDIVDYTSAGVVINCYGGVSSLFQGVGSYSFITTTTNSLNLYVNNAGQGNLVGSITNLSVIAITEDTNLPRINYEGFSYQDALGSEEVVNGGFDTDTAWIKGTTWSIGGGFASATENDGSYLYQTNICEIGKKYKFTFDVTESSGVQQCVSLFNIWFDTSALAVGSYSIIHTAVNTSGIRFRCKTGGTGSFAIDNVSVKEYLGQEVVPDSGCGSWLFEPQSTNLVTDSQNYNSTYWGGQRGNLSDGGVGLFYLSPNSNVIKYEVNQTQFNQMYCRLPSNVTIGNTYTQQGYVKCDDAPYIHFQVQTLSGNPTIVWDNVNNIVISAGAAIDSYNITSLNGWVKAEITYTATVATIYASLKTYFSTSSTTNWAGVPIGTIAYQTFVQVEELPYATSYIPTEGSTVTRNQDVCNNGGSLASINSTEGVIYWEGAKLQEASGTQVLGLSDGSGANRIGFQTSPNVNQIRFVVDAGGNQASKFFVLDDITDFNKYALKWKQDDFSFWVNGIKIGTDTSGNVPALNALNTLDFYYGTGNGTGIYNFTAKTKALAVWKEALSDEELTELTTI